MRRFLFLAVWLVLPHPAVADQDSLDHKIKALLGGWESIEEVVDLGLTRLDQAQSDRCGRWLAREVYEAIERHERARNAVIAQSLHRTEIWIDRDERRAFRAGQWLPVRSRNLRGLRAVLDGDYRETPMGLDVTVRIATEIGAITVRYQRPYQDPCLRFGNSQLKLAEDLQTIDLEIVLTTDKGPRPRYLVSDPPQEIEISIGVSRDAFITCFVRDQEGRVAKLLPNAWLAQIRLEGGETFSLPGDLIPNHPSSSGLVWLATSEGRDLYKCFARPDPWDLPPPIDGRPDQMAAIEGIDDQTLLDLVRDAAHGRLSEAHIFVEVY